MADFDYSAPLTDDEDQRRQLPAVGDYPAPHPPGGGLVPAGAEAPLSSELQNYPAPMKPSLAQAAPAQAAPRWQDYAPPQPHGWGAFGHAMATLHPITNQIFNKGPEQRAELAYKNAAGEYEAGIGNEQKAAQTESEKAGTKLTEAQTEQIGQPAAKEATWKAVPGVIGPEGKILQESTSGEMRWAPGISGAGALKTGAEKPDTPEQQAIDEYMRTHPGASVAQAERAYKENTTVRDTTGRDQNRSDRSYTLQSGRIDKLRQPIKDRMERITRLDDTLNQGTPQADSLVAPELLSIMAGGQASGLRMNEAEISRIIGGRTNWESLKAAIGKWQLDPNKGFAITPDQRQQIRALFNAVKERTSGKLNIIDEEEDHLLDSDDPKEHRKIVSRLQHRLTEADTGKAPGGETNTAGGETKFAVPQGAPAAPKEDGHKLKQGGKAIAVSKGGQWQAP